MVVVVPDGCSDGGRRLGGGVVVDWGGGWLNGGMKGMMREGKAWRWRRGAGVKGRVVGCGEGLGPGTGLKWLEAAQGEGREVGVPAIFVTSPYGRRETGRPLFPLLSRQ